MPSIVKSYAMGTIAAFGKLFRDSARSPLAWLLVAIHAALFFLAVTSMRPPNPAYGQVLDAGGSWNTTLFAGRPFHFYYESLLLKILFTVDLPAGLAVIPAALIGDLFLRALNIGSYVGSYLGAALFLLASSCQWLAVGGLLRRRYAPRGPS